MMRRTAEECSKKLGSAARGQGRSDWTRGYRESHIRLVLAAGFLLGA